MSLLAVSDSVKNQTTAFSLRPWYYKNNVLKEMIMIMKLLSFCTILEIFQVHSQNQWSNFLLQRTVSM